MVILAQSKNVMLTPVLTHSKFQETQYGQWSFPFSNTSSSSLRGKFLAALFPYHLIFLLSSPLPLYLSLALVGTF